MRDLIGLVKSIVLMGRIYTVDSCQNASHPPLSLASSRFRDRPPPLLYELGEAGELVKEVFRSGMASCAQGVVQHRPANCDDRTVSLAGQPRMFMQNAEHSYVAWYIGSLLKMDFLRFPGEALDQFADARYPTTSVVVEAPN